MLSAALVVKDLNNSSPSEYKELKVIEEMYFVHPDKPLSEDSLELCKRHYFLGVSQFGWGVWKLTQSESSVRPASPCLRPARCGSSGGVRGM